MKANPNNGKAMAVFFSHGTTLAEWERGGLLDREVAYYRSLLDHVGGVTFVTYDHPSPKLEELSKRVAPLGVLGNRWGVHYRFFGLLAPLLHYKALRRCALIKTNQLNGAWAGVIAKWVSRKPLVVRCGYVWSRNAIRQGAAGLRKRAILAVEGFVARRADMLFVATEDDRQYMLNAHRVSESKIFVMPNPIDTDRFSPVPGARKRTGLTAYVGRLSPEKNLHTLVKAVMRLSEARLILVGSGPEEAELRRLASDCDRIEFRGSVPNSQIPAILSEAEAFVLPSHYEGSPKALLEAMSCGLAVIGADAPGIREVIRHEVNGLLCDPSEGGLADAIRRTLADGELRQRLGRQARTSVVERHSQQGVARTEVALIERLLERAGK